MVTRKGIQAAFELIVNDAEVHTVTYFCFEHDQEIKKVCRVRVTRSRKDPDDYRVQLGRMNYAERAYFTRRTTKEGISPRVWLKTFPKKAGKA